MVTPNIQSVSNYHLQRLPCQIFLAAAVYESLKPSLQERNQFEAVKLAFFQRAWCKSGNRSDRVCLLSWPANDWMPSWRRALSATLARAPRERDRFFPRKAFCQFRRIVRSNSPKQNDRATLSLNARSKSAYAPPRYSSRNSHPFRSMKLRSISLNSAGCSLYEKWPARLKMYIRESCVFRAIRSNNA
jgi:hypothetical protein